MCYDVLSLKTEGVLFYLRLITGLPRYILVFSTDGRFPVLSSYLFKPWRTHRGEYTSGLFFFSNVPVERRCRENTTSILLQPETHICLICFQNTPENLNVTRRESPAQITGSSLSKNLCGAYIFIQPVHKVSTTKARVGLSSFLFPQPSPSAKPPT